MRALAALLGLLPFAANGAITYIASGTPVEDTGAVLSVAVPLYAGAATGHAMLVHLMFSGDNNGETSFDVAGFELIESEESANASNLVRSQLWCKIHDGSETDPTLSIASPDTGDVVAAFSFGFSGTHTSCTDIIGDTNETDTSGTGDIQTPGLTNTTANSVVLACGVKATSSATPGVATLDTDSLSWVEIAEYDTTAGSDVLGACDYFLDDATPNTISADTFVIDTPAASTARTAAIMVSIKPEAGASGLVGAPTVTAQDTNDYTISGETTGATTVSAVACAKDSTAPSVSQVEAGDCTGDVAALAAVSESWDGADSFVLGGALTLKIYDLYVTDGTALYTLADEQLDVATGYERTILGAQDPTSVYTGTETAAGDYCDTQAVTDPDAFVVTPETDGTISYAAGGSTARQIILGNCHDLSESDIDSYQFVFNNLTCGLDNDLLDDDPTLFQKDVAITAQDSETLCVDPEGDTVDVAVDTLPTGLSLVDTPPWQVTGTPTTCSEITSEFTWTDQYGADYVESAIYQIGDLVPDATGLDEAAAIAEIEGVCSFSAVAGTPIHSNIVDLGNVISTDPVSGWLSPPDQVVTYVLSLGPPTTLAVGDQWPLYAGSLYERGVDPDLELQDFLVDAEFLDITWSVSSGTLPTDWSLNANTGEISGGSPGACGTFTFTIEAVADAVELEIPSTTKIGYRIPDIEGMTPEDAAAAIAAGCE